MKKKGQIGNLTGIILVLIVIGIILGVGMLVLSEFKDQTADAETVRVDNETMTMGAASTAAAVNTTGDTCFNDMAVIRITNSSSAVTLIAADNYTYSTNGNIVTAAASAYASKGVNVTYTYNRGGTACGAIETTTSAMNEIPAWLSILVIMAIIGIIIAIVFTVLPSGGGSGGFGRGSSGGVTAEI